MKYWFIVWKDVLPLHSLRAGILNLRNVVEKNVHATIQKGKMGYDQYTVRDPEADEPTFTAFL